MSAPAGRSWSVLRAAGALAIAAALLGGVPYLLARFAGWPLPGHLPGWPQLRVFLTSPLTTQAIIKGLACVVWLVWLLFALSLAAEMAAVIRGGHVPRLPVAEPLQAFAAALVSAVTLSTTLAPHRTVATVPLHTVLAPAASIPAATAPADPALTTAGPALALAAGNSRPAVASRNHRPRPRIYRVVEGDSLWDIAARRLGNGERWQEIYVLNRDRPQPGGGALTDPSLIYPGWVLLLPAPPSGGPPSSGPSHHRPGNQPEHHPSVAGTPNPSPGTPRPAGAHQSRPPSPARPGRAAGVHLPAGGLVGITLAAALSMALAGWRLHRRRAAVPRWPIPDERADPPLPEAISALRRAHLRSLAADAAEARGEPWPDDALPPPVDAGDAGELDEFGAPAAGQPATSPRARGGHLPSLQPEADTAAGASAQSPLPAPVPSPAPVSAIGAGTGPDTGQSAGGAGGQPPPARPLPASTVVFATRGSSEIPLADVARPDLGLTGPGARAAARALMTGLLAAPGPATAHTGSRVVIPAPDVGQLTGNHQAAQITGVSPGLPDGLTITPSLAAALDLIETEITRRLRRQETREEVPGPSATPHTGGAGLAPLALIATLDPASVPRVRAALDAGASAGITGILLGNWPGTTCSIGADGVVLTATNPALAGVQACHLPTAGTAAMLSLLRGAQGHLAPGEPGPAAPPAPGSQAAAASGPGGSRQSAGSGTSARSAGNSRSNDAQPPDRDLAPPVPGPAATPPPAGGLSAGGSDAASRSPAPAATALSTVPAPAAARPVVISVLGPLRITTTSGTEIMGGLRKARELLAYLAVHPEGVTGEGISADLWPESGPRYAASQRKLTLRKAREMLRTATGQPAPLFVILAGDRYQLDPALIEVDLWRFDAALDRARQTRSEQDQLASLREATGLYQGPLADGADYEWGERFAEPARRRAVDAIARIAALLAPGDPEQALTVLETALVHDSYNEALYQEIMRIQARLGRPDAARRTLALLQTRLASLGLSPDPASLQTAGVPPGDSPAAQLPGTGHSLREGRPGSAAQSGSGR